MTHREKAKELIAQRDEIERKIGEQLAILEANNSTMDSPLVDSEGYPIDKIDVYSVRHARHEIIKLRNDMKELTNQIATELEAAHELEPRAPQQSDQSAGAAQPSVHRTSNEAFARISNVADSSPAKECGLSKDDLILQYGSLHFGNFRELRQLAEITGASENKTIRVTVIRNERPVRLELKPKKWSGPGLLGCNIVPLTGQSM
ncbi:unnamed protein product [Caenorhabditis bovis]|uniref:26S proteasome non-ATPase regulatory subunit 9 n=1 Tax=Caenorhabditis bovis TaxID=2654633 RepID=A0A8S1EUD3_9PELO|nr:unnamed protein product [Caenorhabditis bovis]